MATTTITDQLELIAAGGWCSLKLYVEGDGLADLVLVRMNPDTTASFTAAIDREEIDWSNADASLRVRGSADEATFVIRLNGPPWTAAITLGREPMTRLLAALQGAQ